MRNVGIALGGGKAFAVAVPILAGVIVLAAYGVFRLFAQYAGQ